MDIQNRFEPAGRVAAFIAVPRLLWHRGRRSRPQDHRVAPVAEVQVPNGTPLLDALAKLPRAVTLTANEGEPVTSAVIWNPSETVITSRGGNTIPQSSSFISVGLTSQHIDASEVIWEHLSKHRLPKS